MASVKLQRYRKAVFQAVTDSYFGSAPDPDITSWRREDYEQAVRECKAYAEHSYSHSDITDFGLDLDSLYDSTILEAYN